MLPIPTKSRISSLTSGTPSKPPQNPNAADTLPTRQQALQFGNLKPRTSLPHDNAASSGGRIRRACPVLMKMSPSDAAVASGCEEPHVPGAWPFENVDSAERPSSLPARQHMSADLVTTVSAEGFFANAMSLAVDAVANAVAYLKRSTGLGLSDVSFVPLTFDTAEKWPRSASHATPREKELLHALVGLIEEHAKGLYENVLFKSHRSGKGVTEAGPLLDPDNFAYLQKPGNLSEQMRHLIDGLSPNESRLLYSVLVQTDKKTAKIDDILSGHSAQADGFDLTATLQIIDPITSHYLAKKLAPEAHKVPGVEYSASFMRTGGLRPNTTRLPVTVTEHLAYHASVAILLDALKLEKFPDAHARMQKKFDREKLHARTEVWCIGTGQSDKPLPDYMPSLPDHAFHGVELPAETKIVPALVDIPLAKGRTVETTASVAVHPQNGRCLSEFIDHTCEPPTISYAVSSDKPPMLAIKTGATEVQAFRAHPDAVACWNDGNPQGLKAGQTADPELPAGQ